MAYLTLYVKHGPVAYTSNTKHGPVAYTSNTKHGPVAYGLTYLIHGPVAYGLTYLIHGPVACTHIPYMALWHVLIYLTWPCGINSLDIRHGPVA